MLNDLILKQYLTSPKDIKKHDFYDRSVLITNALESHSKGKYPKDIIEVVRPNESTAERDYRKSVYTPITQTYFSKVVSVIAKIARAEDWNVKFPEQDDILEEESLEDYTEDNYPNNFDSLINWFFSLQIREMCDDPNGVVAIFPYPKINPDDDSEFLRPFTFWFESEDVIDFQEGRLAVLRSSEKSIVKQNGNAVRQGLIYYIFDDESWTKCEQIGELDDYRFSYNIQPHLIGRLPCFKIGGIIEEFKNGEMLYDSFVGDCLPFWNESIRRHSDLQVQLALHVHSEKWEIEDTACKTCGGTGKIKTQYMGAQQNTLINCGSCGGSGCTTSRSPFNVKLVKPAAQKGVNDTVSIPTPPMGYITKPIDDTKFINDQVNENIEKGLAAINMEFLMFEPQVNSGIAKTMDRQEMNSFLYNIARHVVNNILYPSYYIIAKWRYANIYNEDQILAILPHIKIPSNFDVLSQDVIIQRLANAKSASLSSGLMTELETEYAKKEFGEESFQVQLLTTSFQLDPLPAKDETEKMTILSNKGTTLEKYILSSNLISFINRAYAENDQFFDLKYSEKMKIMDQYVEEIKDLQNQSKVPIIQLPPAEGYEPNPNTNPDPNTSGSDDSGLDDTADGNALPTKSVQKITRKRIDA